MVPTDLRTGVRIVPLNAVPTYAICKAIFLLVVFSRTVVVFDRSGDDSGGAMTALLAAQVATKPEGCCRRETLFSGNMLAFSAIKDALKRNTGCWLPPANNTSIRLRKACNLAVRLEARVKSTIWLIVLLLRRVPKHESKTDAFQRDSAWTHVWMKHDPACHKCGMRCPV
jgi:hypothetical protein